MDEYLNIFIDQEYPQFIDKYLNTKTMNRIKYVTQFCGCDYTKLYSPLFLYTRYNHSLVVAHMTWHFTHNKKQTIAALLHDAGTPCFSHSIDYVFGDYVNQESSEKKITDIISKDLKLLSYLKEDGLNLSDFEDFKKYHVLENRSPKLCTDRLDGVLHSCYIWLHTHSLDEIKEVYDDMIILKNEENHDEIGFKNIDIAIKFSYMVFNYAKELQGNKDKYIMKYISEMVKLAASKNLITLEDLYEMKEEDICNIFKNNFSSFKKFNEAFDLIKSDECPNNTFYISFDTKKRNTIPLAKYKDGAKRIDELSFEAKKIYDEFASYHDSKYAYVKEINSLM